MTEHPPIVVRVLAILAAICVVASFSLALLLPPTLSLAGVIARLDHIFLVGLQDAVKGTFGDWMWAKVAMPVLTRPGWLLPLALGIVFGGVAVSLATRRAAPRSRHRRP